MSAGMKWIVGIIIVIIIGVGAWYWLSAHGSPSNTPQSESAAVNNTQGTTTANTTGLPTAQNDTSNAAIVQDAAAIYGQMQGLSSDSVSLNQSLNDTPVPQSY